MNVLLIAPYFPPHTGVGVLRPASLADYLLQAGDEVSVLKLADRCYPPGMAGGTPAAGPSYMEFAEGRTERDSAENLCAALEQALRGARFDCCLVTCGPFYTLRPALELTRRYGVPLAIDYRDLWLYNTNPRQSLRSVLGGLRERFRFRILETALMEGCVAFTTVSPRGLAIMKRHYPALEGKSACIYNGYSLPMREGSPGPCPDRSEIRLFILGKLAYYSRKNALAFLRAAGGLLRKGYSVRLIRAGPPEDFQALLQPAGFPPERFEDLGPLSYEESMAAAGSAHICLGAASKVGLSTKFFDYVCLNKPMVFLVPKNSELEMLAGGVENAFFCQTASHLEAAMEQIIAENRWVLTDDAEFRNRFSREEQNRRFRRLLLDAAEKGGKRG